MMNKNDWKVGQRLREVETGDTLRVESSRFVDGLILVRESNPHVGFSFDEQTEAERFEPIDEHGQSPWDKVLELCLWAESTIDMIRQDDSGGLAANLETRGAEKLILAIRALPRR